MSPDIRIDFLTPPHGPARSAGSDGREALRTTVSAGASGEIPAPAPGGATPAPRSRLDSPADGAAISTSGSPGLMPPPATVALSDARGGAATRGGHAHSRPEIFFRPPGRQVYARKSSRTEGS
ncbi:hypothetical protein GCM10020227_63940 [Streptomyces flavovirens]